MNSRSIIVVFLILFKIIAVANRAKAEMPIECPAIGEDGHKTLEMFDCEHRQNLQWEKWKNSAGLGKLIK